MDGRTLTFGVSGLLYKSNVLLYDHQSESLWSQLMERAIAGPLAGRHLTKLESRRTTWEAWRKRYPHTEVLSRDTGFPRDYATDPYEGYARSLGIWFPVGDMRTDLSPKEMVVGIEMAGKAKAYPVSELQNVRGALQDEIAGEAIRIEVSPRGQVGRVEDRQRRPIPHIFSYWFAWQAFHPETEVYGVREDGR